MSLLTIAGHSFDADLLPERPYVLDVGCRGFDFTQGIRGLRPGAFIYALDPDPAIVKPEHVGCVHLKLAMVHHTRGRSRYATGSTGEGNFLTEVLSHNDYTIIDVDTISTQEMTALLPPAANGRWDLVKLDAEGSEFGILENWPGPIARQLSIEFHDYDRRWKYPDSYYEALFARLGTFGYRVVKHELSDISGRGAIGFWDSVILLEA